MTSSCRTSSGAGAIAPSLRNPVPVRDNTMFTVSAGVRITPRTRGVFAVYCVPELILAGLPLYNSTASNMVEEASGRAVSTTYFKFPSTIPSLSESATLLRMVEMLAFSIALYVSNINSSRNPDGVNFTDCNFIDNLAENEGTAVGLFPLVYVD